MEVREMEVGETEKKKKKRRRRNWVWARILEGYLILQSFNQIVVCCCRKHNDFVVKK